MVLPRPGPKVATGKVSTSATAGSGAGAATGSGVETDAGAGAGSGTATGTGTGSKTGSGAATSAGPATTDASKGSGAETSVGPVTTGAAEGSGAATSVGPVTTGAKADSGAVGAVNGVAVNGTSVNVTMAAAGSGSPAFAAPAANGNASKTRRRIDRFMVSVPACNGGKSSREPVSAQEKQTGACKGNGARRGACAPPPRRGRLGAMKRKNAPARRRAVPLADLVAWLDRTLDLPAFADDVSNNGLQVEGASRGVSKVVCGVDASPAFHAEALRRGAQLLVVHHGISWGNSLARIAGPAYRLVAPLVRADAALYAAHLPLDAHPVLGNNAQIAKALGLRGVRPFGTYRGCTIGVRGSFPRAIPWEEAKARFRAICPGGRFDSVDGGKKTVRTVGIVSGGGADELPQAVDAGLDAFFTGEFGLQHYNATLCGPIDLAAAGHYATERFGVRALGAALAAEFGIDWEFVDFSLPW